MNFRRLISMLLKEYRHILREPRTMWMVFLSPAFVLVALAALFGSGSGRVDLALWDHDRSAVSRRFADTLGSDADFSIIHATSYEEIESLMVAHRVDAAVIIPPGFGSGVQGGDSIPVQVILDGVDTFSANQATGSLLAHAADFSFQVMGGAGSAPAPVQVRPQPAYLAEATRRSSMIPGLIPIVFSLPAMAAALALARERETGSLESLVATPVRGLEYLLGKLIAYVSAGLVALLPVLVVATLFFGVPFNGNPLLLVLLTAVFLLASMAQAVFIGSRVGSQQTATVITLFVFFVPGFFLAGLIDPIDPTSPVGSSMSYLLPVTHFVVICRALFLKGASLAAMWRPVAALLALATGWMTLSVLTFKKRMSV
jgi:ABC-2 type transport system permease protein